MSWKSVRLEEVAAPSPHALSTGPFGSAISAKFFVDQGVPVIRGSNLSEDVGVRLIEDELAFITEEKASLFKRSTVRENDVIFTCWGSIGQVGFIDAHSQYNQYVISNKQMKITPNTDVVDPLFLYYVCSSPSFVNRVKLQGIGTSVPGFNLGQLRTRANRRLSGQPCLNSFTNKIMAMANAS